MGHSEMHRSTNNMKGFIFFALLIVGVYSSQLREIRLNIKDELGCQGKDLKIRLTRSSGDHSDTCETQMKGIFPRGDTLVWKADDYSYGEFVTGELGQCQGFDFNRDTKFSLVYSGTGRQMRRYCPSMIEFLTRSGDSNFLDSFKKLRLNSANGHRFSSSENDILFDVIPNSEAVDIPATCPSEGQGCPVNELVAFRKKPQQDRQQCIFQ